MPDFNWFLMPLIPHRIGVQALETFWWDGFFKGVGISVLAVLAVRAIAQSINRSQ